jgi:hypothetical protein
VYVAAHAVLEYGASGEIATWSPKTEKFTINKLLASPQLVRRSFSQLAQAVSYRTAPPTQSTPPSSCTATSSRRT